MGKKELSDMTDEELQAEADRLAEERTATRLQQNAVQAEIDIRRALSTLNPETRRIVEIKLAGGTVPAGAVAAEKVQ